MLELKVRNKQAPTGVFGKLFLSLFFLVFAGFGIAFIGLFIGTQISDFKALFWKEAKCRIIESSLEQNPKRRSNHKFLVRYSYNVNGSEYTGERYSFSKNPHKKSEVSGLVSSYPAGKEATCFYDPSNPSESVLKVHVEWAVLPFMLIPLVFILIGFGGIYYTWSAKGANGKKKPKPSVRKNRGSKVLGYTIGILFFSVFFLIGLTFMVMILFYPAFKLLQARSWQETPCKILSSDVEGDETYKVVIRYRYEVNGTQYESVNYNFISASTSGYSGKKAIVNQHPVGSQKTCYVNPSNPGEAVLSREFSAAMLFGLIPLVFVLIGGGGLFLVIRHMLGRKKPGGLPGASYDYFSPPGMDAAYSRGFDDNWVLRATKKRLLKLCGIIFICLFWNGICSVMFNEAIGTWQKGRPDYFLTLFSIPFLLVGIGLIVGVFYCFMALFSPYPLVTVSRRQVKLGDTLSFDWQISKLDAIRSFTIKLEGIEEATYSRGTSTITDKRTFHTVTVINTRDSAEMASGSAKIVIPKKAMHTFKALHNKIVWRISVVADIERWPDVKDEYELEVLPS